jgi:hypothetical protein
MHEAFIMANLVRPFIRSVLRAWSAVVSRRASPPSDRLQGVILHDPDAEKPKDLDNPFYTAASQERVGDLIARSTTPRKPE